MDRTAFSDRNAVPGSTRTGLTRQNQEVLRAFG